MRGKLAIISIAIIALGKPALAGVVNPNISVIGQPFMRWNDDTSDPSHNHATLNLGEVEGVFD
ncbi:MAG TPA: hypothetical protein VJS69_03195, partial [Candidatus Krumholzibacteria bacterium]|nr:hypothetical protein [Candidatus Krumholzibacteria bacterium]